MDIKNAKNQLITKAHYFKEELQKFAKDNDLIINFNYNGTVIKKIGEGSDPHCILCGGSGKYEYPHSGSESDCNCFIKEQDSF